MKRGTAVLLMLVALVSSCPLADHEAAAFMLPASCVFAEELGWRYWGWSAMCRNDLEMYSVTDVR